MKQSQLLLPDDVADRICSVILFKDAEEMHNWMKDPASIAQLKKIYKPSRHHCLYNTETLQVTILKRSTAC